MRHRKRIRCVPPIRFMITHFSTFTMATLTASAEDERLAAAMQQFTRAALQAKIEKNERKNYNKIVEELSSKDPLVLQRWYTALTQCVSLISPSGDMRELVHQIFSFSVIFPTATSTTATPEAPASTDSRFLLAVHAYCNFLIYLISANAEFLTAALRQLSQHLVYRAELHGDLDAFQDLIHATLLNICRCVPSASSALFPFLLDNYPHKSHPVTAHKVYLKNLLRISEYAPELRDRILEAIVDRLIQIDVEVKAPSEAFSFDSEDNADMFALDDIDDEDDRRTAALPVSPHAQSNSKEMAEKLDALMQLMFEYLTIVRDGSEMLCDEVFASLLRTFDRSIVVTHKSKYTQFLIFYGCSFKHLYAEALLKRLMERAFDPANSIVNRQSCAQYLASFVARSPFLRAASCMACFEMMVSWLHSYVHSYNQVYQTQVGIMDADQHSVFYSICQTVFYVFCMRQDYFTELLAERGPECLERFRFDQIVDSALNPLRFCTSRIVSQFDSLCRSLRVIDCTAVLLRNKRLSSGQTTSMHIHHLLNYFPFDPCNLPITSKYLANIYRRGGADAASASASVPIARSHSIEQQRQSDTPLSVSSSPPAPPLAAMSYTDSSDLNAVGYSPAFGFQANGISPSLAPVGGFGLSPGLSPALVPISGTRTIPNFSLMGNSRPAGAVPIKSNAQLTAPQFDEMSTSFDQLSVSLDDSVQGTMTQALRQQRSTLLGADAKMKGKSFSRRQEGDDSDLSMSMMSPPR